MTYLKEDQLRNIAKFRGNSRFLESTKSVAKVSIFLSHSHRDREIVEGFITLLANSSQITIYVDWQDGDMPRITNRDTAQRIKLKIGELNLFMILATKNAMNSKWVPWEIGVADSKKPLNRILVVPVADPSGHFYGNEYMQLYQRIEVSSSGDLGVFEPNAISGYTVKEWLKSHL
ncbi:MAG: toll/interleukin-1 receptor domain-containing protein [Anaerolineales bacterium]|nr:toll/interleukin-1 receptor domain-containing protein [Anaerolineales bacterium]